MVEARESLVDRRLSHRVLCCHAVVEARESLVDRRARFVGTEWEKSEGRGSREPCGSKEEKLSEVEIHMPSRLARALWIEGGAIYKCGNIICSRGSREPCGSKEQSSSDKLRLDNVEARESLVDRRQNTHARWR